MLFNQGLVMLTNMIENKPGSIVGPISSVFGYIIDFIYKLIFTLAHDQSLGISIIIVTFIVRTIMLPLFFKQQKSMAKMQKLNPEINKIKAKYGDTKDPEVNRKIQAETQALYSKHKVNPFSGCLPSLITLPLFFGLNYVMRQSYLFITDLGAVYRQIAAELQSLPDYINILTPIVFPKLPKGVEIYLSNPDDLMRAINKFSHLDWEKIIGAVTGPKAQSLLALQEQKNLMESFFGINLIDVAGLAWPGIIIPILSVVTNFASSFIMQKTNPYQNNDASTQTQQKVMLYVLPLVMGFFTISMSAGVGIYWITGNVYQVVQQYFMSKMVYGKKEDEKGNEDDGKSRTGPAYHKTNPNNDKPFKNGSGGAGGNKKDRNKNMGGRE